MIHARMAPDGSIYEASHRAPTYPDDVPICRMWGMLEGRLPLTICADDCKLDHTGGARCVVPHEALVLEKQLSTLRAEYEILYQRKFGLMLERSDVRRAGGDSRAVDDKLRELAVCMSETKATIDSHATST